MKTIVLPKDTLLYFSDKGERDTLFKSLIADEIARLFKETFRTDPYLRNYFRDDPNRCLSLHTSSNVYESVDGAGTTYLIDVTADLYKVNTNSNVSVHKVTLNGLYAGIAVGDRCMFCVDNATKAIELIRDNLSFFLGLNGSQYRIYPIGG